MEQTLLRQYIRQQPALWQKLLDGRQDLTAPFARLYRQIQPDRLILLGSGSSHYAARMARPVLEQALGTEVSCLVPSEYAPSAPLRAERPFYIAISQSGASTNICEQIQALRAAGHFVTAVTEREDSPAGLAASLTVAVPTEEERIGAKTKGVTLTVLTLMLMALSVCRDEACQDSLSAALSRLAGAGAENLSRAEAWSRACREELLPFRHFCILGASDGLGAAQEGALKLLETNYHPVSAYPLDEYLHGIQNALDRESCLLFLLPPEGRNRERMLNLRVFARSKGAKCLLITSGGGADGLCLEDPGHAGLRNLVYLPALQTLAAELSEARGIDTSRRRYPGFFARMGSKLAEI